MGFAGPTAEHSRAVRSICSMLVLLVGLRFGERDANAMPKSVGLFGSDGCPSPPSVAALLRELFPALVVEINPAGAVELAARLEDLGERYRIVLPNGARQSVDEARVCLERARVSAAFIALAIAPPEFPEPSTAPTTPPSPSTSTGSSRSSSLGTGRRRTIHVTLEVAGRIEGAPADGLVMGGADARLSLGGRWLQASLGVGALSPASLHLPAVETQLTYVPFDLSLRGLLTRSRVKLGADLGLAAAVLLADGRGIAVPASGVRLDVGLRMGLLVQLWLHSRGSLSLGLHATVLPRPYELTVDPIGTVGHTPSWWLGATLGVSLRLH